ncbi:MAG: hypothetical protein JXB07_09755 [Anaerolineae bacterium]|nr:hypothetical protein [Anaerolineae bacterium]
MNTAFDSSLITQTTTSRPSLVTIFKEDNDFIHGYWDQGRLPRTVMIEDRRSRFLYTRHILRKLRGPRFDDPVQVAPFKVTLHPPQFDTFLYDKKPAESTINIKNYSPDCQD